MIVRGHVDRLDPARPYFPVGDLRLEFDPFPRQDTLDVRADGLKRGAPQDVGNELSGEVFRATGEPGGEAPADPEVAEVTATTRYGHGHIVRNDLQLFP